MGSVRFYKASRGPSERRLRKVLEPLPVSAGFWVGAPIDFKRVHVPSNRKLKLRPLPRVREGECGVHVLSQNSWLKVSKTTNKTSNVFSPTIAPL